MPDLIIPDLDEAVSAVMSLEVWQLPRFCSILAEKGIYINFSIAPYPAGLGGVPLAPQGDVQQES